MYIYSVGLFICFFFCHSFSSTHLSCVHVQQFTFLKISCVFVVPCKAPLVVPFLQSQNKTIPPVIHKRWTPEQRLFPCTLPVAQAECNCTITIALFPVCDSEFVLTWCLNNIQISALNLILFSFIYTASAPVIIVSRCLAETHCKTISLLMSQ